MKLKKSVVVGMVLMTALCLSLPASATQFGVNLNESFDRYDSNLVNAANANWVRGFVELRRFAARYATLKQTSATPVRAMAAEMRGDPQIRALLAINGKNIIVNLKYDYSHTNFPTGVAYDDMERVTQAFLDVVWDKASIIVTGNEPFIESINSDFQRGSALTTFYRNITDFAIQHRNTKVAFRPIYVGAFNNLHETDSAFRYYSDGLLSYAKQTPGVAGVDVHGHVPSHEALGVALDYARAGSGGKRMLVTEYSLIQWWNQNVDNPIQTSSSFNLTPSEASKYHTARQFIDYAMQLKNQRKAMPIARWTAFLDAQPWFSSRQNFLVSARDEMSSRGVVQATYGLLNTQTSLTTSQSPWVLNPLYCTSVCPVVSNQQQWPWFDLFRNSLSH